MFKFNSRPRTWLTLSTLLASLVALSGSPSAHDRNPDSEEEEGCKPLIFSTVGDSRQDNVAPDSTTLPLYGQDSIWLQSTKAWSRIMRGVQEQKSNFLFFNGDMIMGYGNAILPSNPNTVAGILGSDLMAFYKQYAFWRGMVTQLLETGTYVIPVPGNHETQWKAGGKKAQVANEMAWRDNMGDLILDGKRFQNILGEIPGIPLVGDNRNSLDGLISDQSKLTYSFDLRGSHFVVINTDPVGKDSHAPTHWLEADLYAAKARGLDHFFVFGHKPAFTYYFGTAVPPAPALPSPGKASGLDIDIPARDAFWDVIEKYGALYFCGHEHIYNASQPRGKAWQIIVGSGGSPFDAAPHEATLTPTDRYYAWATVKVMPHQKVEIKTYGFNDAFGPTQLLKVIRIP